MFLRIPTISPSLLTRLPPVTKQQIREGKTIDEHERGQSPTHHELKRDGITAEGANRRLKYKLQQAYRGSNAAHVAAMLCHAEFKSVPNVMFSDPAHQLGKTAKHVSIRGSMPLRTEICADGF